MLLQKKVSIELWKLGLLFELYCCTWSPTYTRLIIILSNRPYFGGTVPIFDVKITAVPLFFGFSPSFFVWIFLAFLKGKSASLCMSLFLTENPIKSHYFVCFEVGTYA